MKDRSDDPSHHEQTLLPWSYISLPISKRKIQTNIFAISVADPDFHETFHQHVLCEVELKLKLSIHLVTATSTYHKLLNMVDIAMFFFENMAPDINILFLQLKNQFFSWVLKFKIYYYYYYY